MRRARPHFWPTLPARPLWPWEHTYWAGEAYVNMATEREMLDVAYTDLRNAAITVLESGYRPSEPLDKLRSVVVSGE